MRFLLAGIVAGFAVWFSDLGGWLLVREEASGGMPGSSIVLGVSTSLLAGISTGAVFSLLARLATTRGPVAGLTFGVLVHGVRSLPGLVAGAVVGAVPLVAAVPVRARLLQRSTVLTAAVDVAAVVLALVSFHVLTRWVGRRWPLPPSRIVMGIASGVAAVAAGVLAVLERPWLLPRGLLDLVLIAVAVLAGASVLSGLPTRPRGRRRMRWSAIAVGVAAVAGASGLVVIDRSEAARTDALLEVRPARWVVVDGGSLVDLDGDGFSPLFGGTDCDDLDADINPDAIPIEGNGIDETCSGDDRRAELPWPPRPTFVSLPEGVAQPTGILLLSVDSFRADHLSVYGYSKRTSPNIDALAARSVLFRRAYSAAPTTHLAVPMLVTGKYLPEIRWNKNIHPWGIARETRTIGEILRDARWRLSAFVTAWSFKRPWGYVRGFSHVDTRYAYGFGRGKVYTTMTAPGLVERALEWIESNRSRRWLAWIHFFDPHIRYLPHPEGPDFGDDMVGLYDGEVFFTDRWIGNLLSGIREMGIEDTTAVVLFGDHGEMLGEHGQTVHNTVLWEEAARIPLIVHVPGIRPREVESVTSHIDLPLTLLNLVGIDGGRFGMSGATLIPDLLGQEDPDREIVTEIRYPTVRRALVGPRYKWVENLRSKTNALYDLREDPGELRDVARERPRVARAMQERLRSWQSYYAGRELSDALREAVVRAVPEEAERVGVVFPNGVEVVAIDLGRRWFDRDDTALRVRIYLRTLRRVTDECDMRFAFYQKGGRYPVTGANAHGPAAGLVPFRYFPTGAIVEDVFVIRWRGGRGRANGRMALFCDGKRVRAPAGPHVLSGGQIDLGAIDSSRPRKGSSTVKQVQRRRARRGGAESANPMLRATPP